MSDRAHRIGRAALGVLMLALTMAGGCAPPHVPDESAPPVIVHVDATHEWTDTGVHVQKGDWLYFTATGEISWAALHKTAGPDGIGGSPGWLNSEGLVGRVSPSAGTFEIGARTRPLRSRNLRSQATFPPPPIRMPTDGELTLGFKNYSAGANSGSFEVTIRRACPR